MMLFLLIFLLPLASADYYFNYTVTLTIAPFATNHWQSDNIVGAGYLQYEMNSFDGSFFTVYVMDALNLEKFDNGEPYVWIAQLSEEYVQSANLDTTHVTLSNLNVLVINDNIFDSAQVAIQISFVSDSVPPTPNPPSFDLFQGWNWVTVMIVITVGLILLSLIVGALYIIITRRCGRARSYEVIPASEEDAKKERIMDETNQKNMVQEERY